MVEDKYAMAVLNDGQTIGHVPKFLSKLIFFFLKHEGTLSIKVTGERRFFRSKFLSKLIFFFLKHEGTLSIKVTGERRFFRSSSGMEIR